MLAAGACVAPSVADAYCGGWSRATEDGCIVRPCASGASEQLDVGTGDCAGIATLRQAAADSNIATDRDAGLACADGSPPVLADGKLACVPADALCPRGTRRRDAACDRAPRCAAGEVRDVRRCRSVVGSGAAGPRVDVGAWIHALIGPDVGFGAPDLCAPLALRPAAFGLQPRHALRARITLELRVPDNDTSLVQVEVMSTDEASGGALPAPAAALVDATVRSLVETLRGLGGESSTAAARVTVTCPIESLDPPAPR
jgi:hypothetical protein